MSDLDLMIKIWGSRAQFTRPEFKAEPQTYDVPTHSALRNLVQSIYWKPQIQYRITECWILNPIEKEAVKLNAVKSKAIYRSALQGKTIQIEEDRTQRHAIQLKNVKYIVKFWIHNLSDDPLKKHLEIFKRRVEHGQCFQQPYLGCREFPCYFSFPDGSEKPYPITMPLGHMFHDFDFSRNPPQPIFKWVEIRDGVIRYAS